jgi:hypothetical protein
MRRSELVSIDLGLRISYAANGWTQDIPRMKRMIRQRLSTTRMDRVVPRMKRMIRQRLSTTRMDRVGDGSFL